MLLGALGFGTAVCLLPLAVDQLVICASKPSAILFCICVDERLITVYKHVPAMPVLLHRGCPSAERLGQHHRLKGQRMRTLQQ